MKKNTNHHTLWTEEQDAILQKLVNQNLTSAQIGVLMGRTHRSIESRISIRGFGRHGRSKVFYPKKSPEPTNGAVPAPMPLLDAQLPLEAGPMPQAEVGIVTEDCDVESFLWFMKQAWLEGLVITIPALGATFQCKTGVQSNG